MQIASPAFEHNSPIPSRFTCDGEDISPPLFFSDIPPDARSLVLIVEDPDAPSKTWIHWVVYNIDPRVESVSEHTVPDDGTEGLSDFGTAGYGGPCPPGGKHRYFFKLYALDDLLNPPPDPTASVIVDEMKGHVIEEASFVGIFER